MTGENELTNILMWKELRPIFWDELKSLQNLHKTYRLKTKYQQKELINPIIEQGKIVEHLHQKIKKVEKDLFDEILTVKNLEKEDASYKFYLRETGRAI